MYKYIIAIVIGLTQIAAAKAYPAGPVLCAATGAVDYYTGKALDCKLADTDHVVSQHAAKKAGLRGEALARFVNDPDNLVATHRSVNRSKGSMGIKQFGKRLDGHYKLKYYQRYLKVSLRYGLKKEVARSIVVLAKTKAGRKIAKRILKAGGIRGAGAIVAAATFGLPAVLASLPVIITAGGLVYTAYELGEWAASEKCKREARHGTRDPNSCK